MLLVMTTPYILSMRNQHGKLYTDVTGSQKTADLFFGNLSTPPLVSGGSRILERGVPGL